MDNKEKILEHLRSMGFIPCDLGEIGYAITYNSIDFIYMPDEDEHFLRFSVPNVYEVTETNKHHVLSVVNEINTFIKYIKIMVVNNENVWITYEHYLVKEENIDELLEHIVNLLYATLTIFYRKINGDDIDLNKNVDEEDIEKELCEILDENQP